MKVKANPLLFSSKIKKDGPQVSKQLKNKNLKSIKKSRPTKHKDSPTINKGKVKLALCNEKFKMGSLHRPKPNHNKAVKETEAEKSSDPKLGENELKKSKQNSKLNSNVKQGQHKKSRGKRKTKGCPLDLTNIKSKLDHTEVTDAVNGLLKMVQNKPKKPELLNLEEPIFMNVECIKAPVCPTKQLRFKLPHPLVTELSDILLIVPDKKGDKIYPEKALEYYTELLSKKNVTFINKVMPLRQLKQEYSQFELRKKLVDQFDLILADASVAKMLPKFLGKFAMYNRKMPIPVHLTREDLKNHLEGAIAKSQMTVKSDVHQSNVQVGHTKMTAEEVAKNIVEVAKALPYMWPGGWANVRSLGIKTMFSKLVVLYLSLVTPNKLKMPVEKPQPKGEVVEGELSTFNNLNVVVYPSGDIRFKQGPRREKLVDDSKDDEILKEAAAYAQSSRTVRYSDDESSSEENEKEDEEADGITEAMEKKLLNKYEKSIRKRKSEGDGEEEEEDEEEEEEESSDEEEPVIPPISKSKKRKLESSQKQAKGSPTQKKQQHGLKPQQKGLKPQQNNFNQQQKGKGSGKKQVEGPIGSVQKRGSRGGKKNKMSKDQRKALIKRKKAGKN